MSSHLRPDRHIQRDFFIADISDAAPKDDTASMEHPLFALRAGDKRIRTYERGNYKVEIQPGPYGRATIHDKDVWIYCISQLMELLYYLSDRTQYRGRGYQDTHYDRIGGAYIGPINAMYLTACADS